MSADYYDEYWTAGGRAPLDDPLRATRLALLRDQLAGATGLRVLDVGAGSGDIAAELDADGHDVLGLDVSPQAVGLAARRHPGLRFGAHSAEELPWPVGDGSLDLVVAFEVIEHLLRPRRLLEGAHAALCTGGAIALTTPYHGRLKNVALALGAFDRHFAVDGDHVRFFTDAALRRLLDETGFRVERLVHFGRVPWLWAGVFAWATRR